MPSPVSRARRRTQAATRLMAQAELVARWYADADAGLLARPTRLPDWDVGTVGAHLAVALTELAGLLDRPSRERPLPHHRYVEGYRPAAGEIAAKAAGVAVPEVAAELRAAVDAVGAGLRGQWPEVLAGPRGPVRSDDFVAGRTVELVVHSDDVNEAVADAGAAAIPLDRQALGAATRALASILAERHPGASIEVRMPPAAAVQCASPDHPGPSHTRGTPPNVVEMEPLVFVRLATGRTTWADAVAARAVSASGALADLSAMLPLLA